ncbi:MAG: threonine-phosphate decarboxylase CobD [Halopseudomonas sp.]
MLHHGGRLLQAAQRYQRPADQWLDLSTGINPHGWPVPDLAIDHWQRLPDPDDGLLAAARAYYQCQNLLEVAGSQAAIQALPRLRSACRVGVPSIGYAEHQHAWSLAGHRLQRLDSDQIDQALEQLDVLVLINPNNPTGERFSVEQLLEWQRKLVMRGGWLIVDEAFIDCQPEQSLLRFCPRPGLIVLRSIGKFFGLAGIRAGFVGADLALLDQLTQYLGPWTLSGPTRQVCKLALADSDWQLKTRCRLRDDQRRLQALLTETFVEPVQGTELFQTLATADAGELHQRLARQGILLRRFEQPSQIRFGLPQYEADWQRLQSVLTSLSQISFT